MFKDGFHEIQNKCASPFVCAQPDTGDVDTQCTKNAILQDDNQTCTEGTDCRSGTCKEKKCVAKAVDTQCNENENCQDGLFCDKTKANPVCIAQKDKTACASDFECLNSQGCNKGICTLFFSIANGQLADRPIFCASGDFDGDLGNPGKCMTSTLDQPSKECVLGTTCKYKDTDGKPHTKDCGCNYTDGKSYCPLGSDQQAYKDYTTKFVKYYQSTETSKKHTVYRDYAGYSLTRLMWNAVKYPELDTADKCTVQVFSSSKTYAISILAFLAMIFLF
jgi:hypothetical protein